MIYEKLMLGKKIGKGYAIPRYGIDHAKRRKWPGIRQARIERCFHPGWPAEIGEFLKKNIIIYTGADRFF
jgi:hypothetical protein